MAKQSRAPNVPGKRTGSAKVSERAFGPAAEAFGKELVSTGAKAGALTARVGDLLIKALEPLVYGLERAGEWIAKAVSERLQKVPAEKIVPPNPRVAAPAMQALVYSMEDGFIRELFANLIASDMNADRKGSAHPAFVEIIKEMTTNDARVFLKVIESPQIRFKVALQSGAQLRMREVHFSFNVENLDRHQVAYSFDNLLRLGLIEFRGDEGPDRPELEEQAKAKWAMLEEMARSLGSNPQAMEAMRFVHAPNVHVLRNGIYVTGFGIEFWKACMDERA